MTDDLKALILCHGGNLDGSMASPRFALYLRASFKGTTDELKTIWSLAKCFKVHQYPIFEGRDLHFHLGATHIRPKGRKSVTKTIRNTRGKRKLQSLVALKN